VIALERDEDLRLVLEAAEGARMDDAATVVLVLRPVVVGLPFLGDRIPEPRARRTRCVNREPRVLLGFEVLFRESGDESHDGRRRCHGRDLSRSTSPTR